MTRIIQALVALVSLALLPLVLQAPAAQAEFDPTEPIPCFLQSGEPVCPHYEPAHLLNAWDLEHIRPDAAASLRILEEQAIRNTLANHQLPESDRAAVATWGRTEAQAELYALILQAIRTDEAVRTGDQQNVADWVGRIFQKQAITAAEQAGEEYAKWAGLEIDAYRNLLMSGSGEDALRDFLDDAIQPFDASGRASATGGYCRYRPPAPYQDEYDGSTHQTCYTGCTFTNGCALNTPQYDQFVRWGQTRATAGQGTGPEYFAHASAIALGATFALAPIVGAAVNTVWPLVLAAFSQGVPMFMMATGLAIPAASAGLVVEAAGAASYVGSGYFITAAESLALAIAAEAASMAAAVVVVIVAIVIAVLEGIRVFDGLALPGKLAALIAGARATEVDPAAVLAGPGGPQAILQILVDTVLPAPVVDKRCDNDLLEVWMPRCLNAPPIPAPASDDPHFMVRSPDGSEREAATLALPSHVDGVSHTVRTDGRWFVQRRAKGDDDAWSRSLALSYTDWDGDVQQVWLTGDKSDGFQFAGVEVNAKTGTCRSDGTCWLKRRIYYLGPDGHKYSAVLEPYRPPPGTPRVVTTSPVEGSPVSFDAGGFSPAGALGDVTYRWQFQKAGCTLTCLEYDGPFTGSAPTHTWRGDGTFDVRLTATDAAGRTAETSLTVTVGGVAPRLTVFPGCSSQQLASCNQQTWPADAPVVLWSSVTQNWSDESQQVTVDWGDGDQSTSGHGPVSLHVPDDSIQLGDTSPTSFMVMATHAYAAAGTYQGTVTIRDATGHTVSAPFTEIIETAGQSIDFEPLPEREYGDTFIASATGGRSGNHVVFIASPTSVCRATGDDGSTIRLVGTGDCTVTATQAGNAAYTDADPVARTFRVRPVPLTITADTLTVGSGQLPPSYSWTGVGWRNGDDANALTTPPTCTSAAVNVALGSHPITCSGAADDDYTISYSPGTVTLEPLLDLGAAGLPSGLHAEVTVDGTRVALPVTRRVALGSFHAYAFEPTVTDAEGNLYVAVNRPFEGTVDQNHRVTALYRTVPNLLTVGVSTSRIDVAQAAGLTDTWRQVETRLRLHEQGMAMLYLESFARAVRGIQAPAVQEDFRKLLLAYAQTVYTDIGALGTL